jgi:hypothetical protein
MNAPIKIGAADLQLENIPDDLKTVPSFILWNTEDRDGKITKIPVDPRNGLPVNATLPASGVGFGAAVKAMAKYSVTGIGFMLGGTDFVGVDFDDCISSDGVLDGQVAEIIADIPAYWEVSPSGRGIKGFVHAPGLSLPPGCKFDGYPRPGVVTEIYPGSRYFTITGHAHHLSHGGTLPDSGENVRRLHEGALAHRTERAAAKRRPASANKPKASEPVSLSDQELLDVARRSKDGDKFIALYDRGDWGAWYGDQSTADGWLCSKLAFYLQGDPARVDSAFRASGLYRPKWDRPARAGELYGEGTVSGAIALTREFYTPPRPKTEANGKSTVPTNGNGTRHSHPDAEPIDSFPSQLSQDPETEFDWPEILPLDAWETPEPPTGCLPESLEAVTDAVSECNQTPRDNPQAIATCVISTATHGQYYVKIGQRLENLAVAAGVGADSAERKSADIAHLASPLYAHEAEAREAYRDELAEQEAERQLLESRRTALLKRASKGEDDLRAELADHIRRLNALAALRPKRLTCQDVTPEKLASLLAEQGSIGLLSAEGGPFEGMAGKYSQRAEVATVYMSAFSGEFLAKDTISGGSYFSERPSLAMLVMSQPVHLRGVLMNQLFSGRGLLERFFWVFALPRAGYRDVRSAKPIPESLMADYRDTIRRLLPPITPVNGQPPERLALAISDDGAEALTELSAWLGPQYRPEGDLYHVRAWANRLPTLAAKVATLWHLWDCAHRRAVVAGIVPTEWTVRAVRWIRALPCARRWRGPRRVARARSPG